MPSYNPQNQSIKMTNIKARITDYLFKSKARPVARRLNQAVSFPIQSTTVKKVLVILPRDLNLIDRASMFVQSLRSTFPAWRVELFDVDKLSKSDLNRMQLPKPEILQKLRKAGYHFVLDLNVSSDRLSSFIALMTEAPYRLHLYADSSIYYNIAYQPHRNGKEIIYDPLLNYLRNLFVKN